MAKAAAPRSATVVRKVIAAAENLREQVDNLQFEPTVAWVYNPLRYAWAPHRQYIERFAKASCQVLFLGMNPGPWGMAQTGVPFGQVAAARDWLGLDAPILSPASEHPKRPIEGWQCPRSEVSGERLWGLFRQRFGTPERFFAEHFVSNYCPLVFMEPSARNVTPDKLPASLREPLEQVCDDHLRALIQALAPEWVIGVGAWAALCASRVVPPEIRVGKILHPSPASPLANRDWAGTATRQLQELNIW